MESKNSKKRRIKIYSFLVIIFLTMLPINSWGQATPNVTGTIIDNNKEPLIGASIFVKGTNAGAVTDIDGKFEVKASPQDTIVISYIGYDTKEIMASKVNNKTITLGETKNDLEELVVVGYATSKKVNLTGAVSSINMGNVTESRPITNLSSGLSGLTSGLYVNQSTGRPNDNGATLLVRGQGTLNNSAPLIIVDGVEGDINNVNPQDVESISVLKDASSSSIYGSRAANGVILVTTKQGAEGKTKISYNGYVSFSKPTNGIETVSNYADYMEYYNEAARNTDPKAQPVYSQGKIEEWRAHPNEPYLYPNTNWMDEVFSTGISNNQNISFTTGSKTIRAFGSFSYLKNPGVIENSGFERYSGRLNLSADLKPWLTVGLNASGLTSDADMGSNYMSNLFKNIATPGIVYLNPDGRYGAPENPEENQQMQSPLYLLNSVQGKITDKNFTARFFGKLNLMKGLSIEASYNYLYNNTLEEETPFFADRWSFQADAVTQAASGQTYVRNKEVGNTHYMGDAIMRYQSTFFDKLQFGVMLGASQEKDNVRWFEAKKYDLMDDDMTVIDGATGDAEASGTATDWVMQSYFGRINLSWNDKYLFEGNIRRDGSSRFSKKNRWGIFPSFSLGWRITEEAFMKDIQWLDMLKVRLSWGGLGNNSIGNYDYQPVYNTDNYILNNIVTQGLAQLQLANAGLSWETTYVTNIGLDFQLFKSRLDGTIDIFNKDTRDILIDLPAPILVGDATIPKQNAARVRNRGVEASLKWNDQIGNFKYFVGGNFTFIDNNVTRFKGDEQAISGTNLIQEGYPINIQYVLAVDRILQTDEDMLLVEEMKKNAPIDPATGKQVDPFKAYGTPQKGDFLYKDLNNDGIIDDKDRHTVGNGKAPRITYGISFGGEWKGFDFSCLLQGNSGTEVYWQDKYYQPFLIYGDVINKEVAENAWREGMTDAKYPRLLTRTNVINSQPSDFWVQDKSYLRVKNIQVGYSLPKKLIQKVDIEQVRLYTSMENIFTFTDYNGIDPEVSGTTYPTLKQISIGLNVTF